jgi:hypothetical protein
MANQETSASMTNRECRWVRARLPLCVSNGGPELSNANSNDGDLSAQDHDRVDRHLAVCPCCSDQQIAFGRAFRVLMTASEQSPVDRATPSLWPTLKQRINGQATSVPLARSRPVLGVPGWLTDISTALNRARPRLGSFVVPVSTVSLLVSLVTGAVAWRYWVDAQSTISGNTPPLAQAVAPDTDDGAQSGPSDLDDDNENLASRMAENDALSVSEVSTSRTGASSSKPSAHTRFGFDLDHGTSVAPDPHESKPIY